VTVKNDDNNEDDIYCKIKALKFLDDDTFAFGTASGKIELHRVLFPP